MDEREAYYFCAYQEETALELAGVDKWSSPWTYTMLQAAHTEPFVVRSLAAIGALSKSIKMEHAASVCPTSMRETSREISRKHREFALVSYDKAISGMRQIDTLPERRSSLRKALIACLLVFSIELFLHSPNTAMIQSQAGYDLLQRFEAEYACRHRKAGIASPDSNVVEDELYYEFSRLDLRSAM
jgi:hypothetical protein